MRPDMSGIVAQFGRNSDGIDTEILHFARSAMRQSDHAQRHAEAGINAYRSVVRSGLQPQVFPNGDHDLAMIDQDVCASGFGLVV